MVESKKLKCSGDEVEHLKTPRKCVYWLESLPIISSPHLHKYWLCSTKDEKVSITLDQHIDSATCQLIEQA